MQRLEGFNVNLQDFNILWIRKTSLTWYLNLVLFAVSVTLMKLLMFYAIESLETFANKTNLIQVATQEYFVFID